jgi:ATP-dependent RNA helicase RhlE
MNQVISLLPSKRQNILFSATLSADLEGLNQVLLHEPIVVKTEVEVLTMDNIQQSAYLVSEERRGPLLRYLIKSRQIPQTLIFCSSIYEADNVTDKLCKNGIEACAIHSKKSQLARTDALHLFKQDKIRVLVSTDLISRGIDIPSLPLVINYELPRSPKDYIHRIGRTGRASATGEAISLIIPSAEHHFKVIQKKIKKTIDTIDAAGIDIKGF